MYVDVLISTLPPSLLFLPIMEGDDGSEGSHHDSVARHRQTVVAPFL